MAKDSSGAVMSHWSSLIENFQASPLEFYSLVERAIQQRQVPDTKTSRVDYREGGILSARRQYLRVARGKHIYDICGAPFGTGFFVSSWLTETRSLVGLFLLIGIVIALCGFAFFCFIVMSYIIGFASAVVLSILGFPVVVVVGLLLLFWLLGTVISQSQSWLDDAILDIPFIGTLYEHLFHPVTYYKIDTALMFQKAVHAAVLEVIDGMTTAKGIRALSEMERKPLLKGFSEQ